MSGKGRRTDIRKRMIKVFLRREQSLFDMSRILFKGSNVSLESVHFKLFKLVADTDQKLLGLLLILSTSDRSGKISTIISI